MGCGKSKAADTAQDPALGTPKGLGTSLAKSLGAALGDRGTLGVDARIDKHRDRARTATDAERTWIKAAIETSSLSSMLSGGFDPAHAPRNGPGTLRDAELN